MTISGKLDRALVVLFATLLAAIVIAAIPGSLAGNPLRVQVVNAIMAGRSVAHTPYPLGYPLLAAFSMRHLGILGLEIMQAALYVLTVLFSYLTLEGFGAGRRACALGALLVALYPSLLFAITRFVDTVPSCLLLAAFAWLVMRLKRDGFSLANSLIAGLLFGVVLAMRPNALTVVPVAIWVVLRRNSSTRVYLLRAALTAAIVLAIAAAATVPFKGHLVLTSPYYNAYGFANGTHTHAVEGILRDYNGEMAMPQAMSEQGLPFDALDRDDPAVASMYLRMGFDYIKNHPRKYLALEALKVANLFRPDFRNVSRSFAPRLLGYVFHILIAMIFFAWLALRWFARRTYGALDGALVIPILILYLTPFVLTNTDPRYRIPIDVLLIADSTLCVSVLLRNRPVTKRAAAAA